MRFLIIVGGLALLAGAATFYPVEPTVTVPNAVKDRYSPVLYSFEYDNEPEPRQLSWIAIVAQHAMPDLNRFTPRCEGFTIGRLTGFRSAPREKLLKVAQAHECGAGFRPDLPALRQRFVERLCPAFILSPWGKKGFTLEGKVDYTGTGKTLRYEISEDTCRTTLAALKST